MKCGASRGFTLLEVLVALLIAGGSLVLIHNAITTSARRGSQARVAARIERAVESKVAELVHGMDSSLEGQLPGSPDHRWSARIVREPGTLKQMRRLILTVHLSGGGILLERSELLHGEGRGR
jgi:prepilin-type N-terminal cleavage/methylation domain-containing protein